jgi:hypothetical protein
MAFISALSVRTYRHLVGLFGVRVDGWLEGWMYLYLETISASKVLEI